MAAVKGVTLLSVSAVGLQKRACAGGERPRTQLSPGLGLCGILRPRKQLTSDTLTPLRLAHGKKEQAPSKRWALGKQLECEPVEEPPGAARTLEAPALVGLQQSEAHCFVIEGGEYGQARGGAEQLEHQRGFLGTELG